METDDATVFTDFVRTLDKTLQVIPQPVRKKLSRNLKRQLSRRGLLHCPAYLFEMPGEKLGDAEAFECLMLDAFAKLFYGLGKDAGKQLRFLKARVASGETIDRLIQHNLKSHVHDLHRKAFPLSAGIHKNVMKAAVMLAADPESRARVTNLKLGKPTSESIFGLAESDKPPVEQNELEEAIKSSDHWQSVLSIVGRFSKSATAGVLRGMLEMVELKVEPFRLGHLEAAIDKFDFEPGTHIPSQTLEVYSGADNTLKELVRTISDADRYHDRQENVDDFLSEANKKILALQCSEKIKTRMIEILQCVTEYARRCDVDRIVGTEIARAVGLPKQTFSDYLKRIETALENPGT